MIIPCPFQKKNLKCFGPYNILERKAEVAYYNDIPSNDLHNVFHASQLQKVFGPVDYPQPNSS